MLIGANANEWYMYVDEAIPRSQYLEDLATNYTNFKDELQALLDPDDPRMAMDKLYSSSEMLCTSMFIAAQMASSTPEVYAYQFSRVRSGPGGKKLLAYHGAEIPYIFDTHDDWFTTEEQDRILTESMSAYWVQFARTGNPNAEGLPHWPVFGSDRNYLELGDRIVAQQNVEGEICSILEKRLELNVVR